MKCLKKLLSITFAILLMTTLTACTDSSDSNNSSNVASEGVIFETLENTEGSQKGFLYTLNSDAEFKEKYLLEAFNLYARENMFCYLPDFASYEEILENSDNLGLAQFQALFVNHYKIKYLGAELESYLTTDEMEAALENMFYASEYPEIEHQSYLQEVVFEDQQYSLMPMGTLYYSGLFYILEDYSYEDGIFDAIYNVYYLDSYVATEALLTTQLNQEIIIADYFTDLSSAGSYQVQIFTDDETAKIISHNAV